MVNDVPDFSQYSYRVERELGHNRAGGRVTYLAVDVRTGQQVVIKQFQFAKAGSSWSDYDAYDREIQLLKDLEHLGIPRYLDAFQTDDGFCMVQEYKEATSLADARSYNPEDIRQIAIAVLEILVYLQNRIPPVIHRDFKPDNILVDAQGTVYLVDFGFARVGGGEVGVSSVVKGTLGFMPPEQLFNRQLTEASDLYGLGMTLICLLTATKSDRIGDLVDISYRVSFKHLVPKLNMQWVNWLEKMVEPRLKDRFPNAVAALAAIPSSPLRPPEAQFSQSTLVFHVPRTGEPFTQSVGITNPIPDTVLEGAWEPAPHPHDPPVDLYRWITVTPTTFVGNQTECQITIDPRHLMMGKTYHRKLLLQTNTLAKTYSLAIQVQTASNLGKPNLIPYGLLSFLCGSATMIAWLLSWFVLVVGTVSQNAGISGFGAMVGVAIGLELSAWLMRSSGWRIGAGASSFAAIMVGIVVLLSVFTGAISQAGVGVIFGAGAGLMGSAIAGMILGVISEKLVVQGQPKPLAVTTALLSMGLGTSLGLGVTLGFLNAFVLPLLLITGLALATLTTQQFLQQANTTLVRRTSGRHLIKP